jgi:HKD family nuclease
MSTERTLQQKFDDENLRRANEGKPPLVKHESPNPLRKRLVDAMNACEEAIWMLDDAYGRGLRKDV